MYFPNTPLWWSKVCVQCDSSKHFFLWEYPPPHCNPVFTGETNEGAHNKVIEGGREGEMVWWDDQQKSPAEISCAC